MADGDRKADEGRVGPYAAYEGSRVWQALRKGLDDLEKNGDIRITTERKLVIGYLSKLLVKRHVAQHSKGTRKKGK